MAIESASLPVHGSSLLAMTLRCFIAFGPRVVTDCFTLTS
jgi:hypothetical protein